ncbi:MAG TPA: hypothetical protein DIU23_00290 [Candidatus Pacebacteria bacterium]|nr:hypothetical protein [Candidatus Paceibacterota bacterium]
MCDNVRVVPYPAGKEYMRAALGEIGRSVGRFFRRPEKPREVLTCPPRVLDFVDSLCLGITQQLDREFGAGTIHTYDIVFHQDRGGCGALCVIFYDIGELPLHQTYAEIVLKNKGAVDVRCVRFGGGVFCEGYFLVDDVQEKIAENTPHIANPRDPLAQ